MDVNKLKALAHVEDPKIFNSALNHIANGGSLIDLCKMWELRYSDVMRVIRSNPDLKARYDQAMVDREEWAKERVLAEFKALATFSIKDLFDSNGVPIPIHQLPDQVASAIKEINADGDVKMVDKLKALDSLGKHMAGLVDKKEISGTLTLEQAILAAYKELDGDADSGQRN